MFLIVKGVFDLDLFVGSGELGKSPVTSSVEVVWIVVIWIDKNQAFSLGLVHWFVATLSVLPIAVVTLERDGPDHMVLLELGKLVVNKALVVLFFLELSQLVVLLFGPIDRFFQVNR